MPPSSRRAGCRPPAPAPPDRRPTSFSFASAVVLSIGVVNGSTGGTKLRWRLALPAGALAAVILSACGSPVESGSPSPAPSVPPLQSVVASAVSLTCAPCVVKGPNRRLSVGILDATGNPVGGGVSVKVQVYLLPPGNAQPTAIGPVMDAPYEGGLLQNKGVYVVHQTFENAGFY